MALESLQKLNDRNIEAAILYALENITEEPEWLFEIAGPVENSDTGEEEYVDVGTIPRMRPWRGPRQAATLGTEGKKLSVKPFETGVTVSRRDLRRDKLGKVRTRLGEVVTAAGTRHWEELILDVVRKSSTTAYTTYDAKAIFSATHKAGTTTGISNIHTNTVSDVAAITVAEMEKAIWDTIENTIYKAVDDRGYPQNRGVKNFVLTYPTVMRRAIAGALNAPIILNGGQSETNILVAASDYRFRLVADPQPVNTDRFQLWVSDGMPIKRMQETDSLIVENLDARSEHAYKTNNVEYGVSVERAIDGFRWQAAGEARFST